MKKLLPFSIFVLLLFVAEAQHTHRAETSRAEFLGRSRPLGGLPAFVPGRSDKKLRELFPKEVPNFTLSQPMPTPYADAALPRGGDPLAAAAQRSPLSAVEPDTVLEGISRIEAGVFPPDPVGDVSPDHFIQLTNTNPSTYMRVYNKEGAIVLDMPSLNSLWAEFNASGNGDPIVLWDEAAERWLITERTSLFAGSNQFLLVAISETSDPLGRWLAYRFQTPEFPDYPKYGVWHNAYVVTTNERGIELPIYALEREAMLAGSETVQVRRMSIPKFGDGSGFQVAMPVDFDGLNPPPPGSPAYVLRLYDDAWEGGQDRIELWEVHIDWQDVDNTFLTGPVEIYGAPFDAEICEVSFYSCVPQPNGGLIDALQDIILHRAPYLNFGGHESILLHFAVDADGNNRAGLRWMELRRNSGGWQLYQEGTFAPDDGLHRFAGGIAMDYNGNMLMAYTVAGHDKEPSLRFTGRRADDPPGQMTVEEYEFGFGLSSQDGNRWGDYASMSIDPATGKDFWFTGEYMRGNGNWGTKVMKAHLQEDSTDTGPRALLRPGDAPSLTASEPVEVTIVNYGLKAIAGVSVSYSVDGGLLSTDTIADTIPAGTEYRHTFSTTANLSAAGAHEFLIFTSLEGDSLRLNDTLRTVIYRLPQNDVAISSILGLAEPVCDTSRLATVNLINNGVDSLFSLSLASQFNDEPPVLLDWTGALPPGGRESFGIPLGPFIDGLNRFAVTATMPNGLPDEIPDNSFREVFFTAPSTNQTAVMQLRTDEYPNETTWKLSSAAGSLLSFGGPYSEGETLLEEHFCLTDSCYTFTLYDSFGDGLGGESPGSLQILDEEGRLLAVLDEADFGERIDLDFCFGSFACLLTLSAVVNNASAPGAADGQIFLSLSNGTPPFEYSIDGGFTFQSTPAFNGLSSGEYHVVCRDASMCEADTVLMLGACNLMASAEVVNTSGPDLGDGQVTLLVSGGTGPYVYSINGVDFQEENVFEGLEAREYEIIIRDEGTGCETSITIIIDVALATEEPAFFGRQVTLFPNPTEGYVRIAVRGAGNAAFLPLRILDGDGRVVRRGRLVRYGELAKGVVSLYGLPAGMYYLHFLHENFPGAYTVVKQ